MGLFCSSGAALMFAWRDYMPTFTEASLIAAGTGAMLWAVMVHDAAARRRTRIGLLGFAALFNDAAYGGPLKSGYPPGEITFSADAIPHNLRSMPAHLIQAMPMLVLELAGLAWITGRRVLLGRADGEEGGAVRRDFAADTWMTLPGLSTVQTARFYVPAIGAVALLGAWLVVQAVAPRLVRVIDISCRTTRPNAALGADAARTAGRLVRSRHGVVKPTATCTSRDRVSGPRELRPARERGCMTATLGFSVTRPECQEKTRIERERRYSRHTA